MSFALGPNSMKVYVYIPWSPTEEIKKSQLKMNNAINEIKVTLEGTMSRITETEDRISEVEDKMVEINEAERKKEKRIKRNEDNLRDWEDKCWFSYAKETHVTTKQLFGIFVHQTAERWRRVVIFIRPHKLHSCWEKSYTNINGYLEN